MNKQLINLSVTSALLLVSQSVLAASFVVQRVEIQGLQSLTQTAVMPYIRVTPGQTFSDTQADEVAKALYQSGLFEDVKLGRRGNVLVVQVAERKDTVNSDVISELVITGNKKVPSDKIRELLRKLNITQGDRVSRSALETAQQELQKQYAGIGLAAATVDISVKEIGAGRSKVEFKINEGAVIKILGIKIEGNRAYPQSTLLSQFESGVKPAFSVFSDRDKYSREKVLADLDKLTAFYRDRGFLKFEITDTKTDLSPDKRGIYITIKVNEGAQYKIGTVKVDGSVNLSQAQINQAVTLRQGQIFSQRNLEQTRKNIEDALGKQGFAFTRIALTPDINEATKVVSVIMTVDQGKRAYVRRINIRGNHRTKDEVYRREIRQLESSPLSKDAVERSKVRLQRLPYVEDVAITAEPVAGTPDQVDLNVVLTEKSSNQFRIGAGYSQSGGFLFNTELQQDNFMGTGKELNIAFDNSSANRNFRIGYNNPFYTTSGISRGFDIYYNKYDASKEDISNYVSNRVGASVSHSFPISENNAFHVKFGAEQRKIVLGTDPATHIADFVATNGEKYRQLPMTVSYVHDTRNRALFPNEGQRHRLSLQTALPGSDLQYYKVGYEGAMYQKINDDMTFALKGQVGAGKGRKGLSELPFFEKYTAGGMGTVRGYDQNSLGSRDSKGDYKGGDLMVAGTAEVQFPVPFAKDVKGLKMSAFVDAGNVYDNTSAFESKDIRASAGLGAIWISPFGPLEISVARPLNAKDGDKKQTVQFSLGASF